MTDDKACGHDELETLRQVIAGEASRTAAAVAAAREEQREACARIGELAANERPRTIGERIRATPLTATPLADRIADLERVLAKSLANRIVEKAQQVDQPCGHPAAVANKSVETGVVFCDMCRLNEMLNDALTMEARHKAERDALRVGESELVNAVERQQKRAMAAEAQVEAARAACAHIHGVGTKAAVDAQADILAAMESAPESKR